MKNIILSLTMPFVLFLVGCNQDCIGTVSSSQISQSNINQSCVSSEKRAPSSVELPSTTPPTDPQASYAPLWDTARPEGKAWTKFMMNLVQNDLATALLPGADDIELFCPKYNSLNNNERANLWTLLISAIVKYESDFSPTSRMKETTMGTDPVTGQHVYSEGLMQLSYQDIEWAPYCKFNWNADKKLLPTDPKKTILNPEINLDCGTRILAEQVKKLGVIAAPAKNAYWAVLIPNGKYTQLDNIRAYTKKMPGCVR